MGAFLDAHGAPLGYSPSAHGAPTALGGAETRDAAHLALAAAGWTRLGEWERVHRRNLRWQRQGGSAGRGNGDGGGGGGSGSGSGGVGQQLGGMPPPLAGREAEAEAREAEAEEEQMAKRFGAATSLDPTSYLAWHALAMVHFEAAQRDEEQRQGRVSQGEGKHEDKKRRGGAEGIRGRVSEGAAADAALERHVCAAIAAFFRSISLGPRSHGAAMRHGLQDILLTMARLTMALLTMALLTMARLTMARLTMALLTVAGRDSLQDILRLLTLWFRYGMWTAVDAAIRNGLDGDAASASGVALETWLEVIHTSTDVDI